MIESPCTRQCCLNDEDVCCGCFRHIDEITGWQKLAEDQKQNVIEACQNRKQMYLACNNQTIAKLNK